MTKESEGCREHYEKSVTRRMWRVYAAGFDGSKKYGQDLSSSPELGAIFEEEMALDAVPNWAAEIVERMIRTLPPCPHYTFPRPLLQICEAIREQKCPEFVISCYTADRDRKTLMSYYVYCLDAWLKNAPLEVATAELAMRDSLGRDWPKIITTIYTSLGMRSEPKMLLVRRLVHRLRWWIKALIWFDDKRDRFLLDVYSGDVRGDEAKYSAYGNAPFGDPWFTERELPEMKELAERIVEMVPDGERILSDIEETWLCAPKVFRYVERLILDIGSIGSAHAPNSDVGILQCEDTYPDIASCQNWYASFMCSLTDWLEGHGEALCELGDLTPVKHWLVRILRHKLHVYAKSTRFGNVVGTRPSGRSGTKTL